MELRSIAIVGPTASGKTRRAVSVANSFGGEIISADSRQVYRGMTLGTGKDLEEYGDVRYHLIDICKAGEKYNLHQFLKDFHLAYEDVLSRGKLPVICGGSGMYIENALNGIHTPEVEPDNALRQRLAGMPLDELASILKQYKNLHNTTDIDTPKRAIRAIEIAEYYKNHPDQAAMASKDQATPLPALVIGVDIPRDVRRQRISERLRARIEQGMIEEVKSLLGEGIPPENLIYYGLEYKYLTLYVMGELTFDEMFAALETAIHQFAKRQMTWFRGMQTRGTDIHWLPYDMGEEDFLAEVRRLWANHQ